MNRQPPPSAGDVCQHFNITSPNSASKEAPENYMAGVPYTKLFPKNPLSLLKADAAEFILAFNAKV
jgi:hypothetical protein